MEEPTHRDSEISITPFEDWMALQVIEMIATNYGRDVSAVEEFFHRFYEHPFQRRHGIRLVALDGQRVCGFQSYFYWPYVRDGSVKRSLQSGQSIVAGDYRGRRIFARLLSFLDQHAVDPPVDFLMGFPVDMSYGSFIRNGWANPFDLAWYGRPTRPLASARGELPSKDDYRFERSPRSVVPSYPANGFSLSKASDFQHWRSSYSETRGQHLHFHYGEGSNELQFELKANRRGRANELVVGDIVGAIDNRHLLRAGFRELVRFTREHRFITFISVAVNPKVDNSAILASIRRTGFLRYWGRTIPFIIKPIRPDPSYTDPGLWHVLRSDIDTW